MITQRRRVLEDGGLIIPADGVYIEGLDGKAYTVDKWQSGNTANSVIVASGDVKFRMALIQQPQKSIHSNYIDPFENYMTGIDLAEAEADYNGAENTANIMKLQPSTGYAAGWCDAYVFPDGKTKVYLPSLGQLWIAWGYKENVDAAFRACGVVGKWESYFNRQVTSTFWGVDDRGFRYFWTLTWGNLRVQYLVSNYTNQVCPFADIS